MTHALVEYLRCPEDLIRFEISRPFSGERGYFRFGPTAVCYGRSSSGFLSQQPAGPLYDTSVDVTTTGVSVRLPFDPDEVTENLRYERYQRHAGADSSKGLRLRTAYYSCVRPLLPASIRRVIQRLALKGWDDIRFPRWPVDGTVDQILEQLLATYMALQGVYQVPFIWFWPDGAESCAVMTHDVDQLAGRDFCSKLMDLDDAAGIRSSFQIVPEKRYSVSEQFLEDIRTRGFEVNVHDLNHDGHLFSSQNEFLRRVGRINEYGRQFGALGFRSGTLYRNQAWFDALTFSYDMSVPSVAHLDPQKGGCCSLTPFFIGTILELPLTTIQDYSLIHVLREHSISLWARQLHSITQRHGLATFNVHPECLLERRALTTYRELLEHLVRVRETRKIWIALPRDVDRWWRERRQMTVVGEAGAWRIEGKGKERARLAIAMLDGDGLTFSVEGSE